ncbi:MAG: ParB/RepB/Spo0J family partition protein [Vulcanimicrobiaceae bacterium]
MSDVIDVKAGARGFAAGTFVGLHLAPHTIKVEPGFNVRDFDAPENQEHVKTLAESIKAVGVQVPIKVRFTNGEFFLVDGESRLRATLLAIADGAPIKTIPAVQEAKFVSEAERVAGLLTHNSGKRLNQIERGEAFARLARFGWTETEIAQKTGITPSYVTSILLLHAAPTTVKRLVLDGKVSSTVAIQAIRAHGDNAVAVLEGAVADAAASGKAKATSKNIPEQPRTKAKRDPFSFSKSEAKELLYGLTAIYFAGKDATASQNMGVCRNIFENHFGDNWKEIAREFHRSMEA